MTKIYWFCTNFVFEHRIPYLHTEYGWQATGRQYPYKLDN